MLLNRPIQMTVILLSAWVAPLLRGQTWHWQSQLGLSIGSDSNIFEAFANPAGDLTSRIQWQFSGISRPAPAHVIQMNGHLGVEVYLLHETEHRGIVDFYGLWGYQISSGWQLKTLLRYRSKTHFYAAHGYGFPIIQAECTRRLNDALAVSLSSEYGHLDYSQGTLFDRSQLDWAMKFQWKANQRLSFTGEWGYGQYRYQRTALTWRPGSDEGSPWIYGNEAQRDQRWHMQCHIEYYNNMLIRFTAAYERVRSNSSGFNFKAPFLHLKAARELCKGLLIHLQWQWQGKQYDDPLDPSLRLRPDTETEAMNMTVFELVKDISETAAVSGRIGWYKNESPFRDRYYEKTMTSLGFRLNL